jgi:hypothetical protein
LSVAGGEFAPFLTARVSHTLFFQLDRLVLFHHDRPDSAIDGIADNEEL